MRFEHSRNQSDIDFANSQHGVDSECDIRSDQPVIERRMVNLKLNVAPNQRSQHCQTPAGLVIQYFWTKQYLVVTAPNS